MRTLYLVRHGHAKSPLEDPERGLSDAGRADVERLAHWAARVEVTVGEIWHSGKRRAEQTAEIIGAALQPSPDVAVVAGLQPNDDVTPIGHQLQTDRTSRMIVGHLPFVGRLASWLVLGDAGPSIVVFEPATLVRLVEDGGQWAIDAVVPPSLIP